MAVANQVLLYGGNITIWRKIQTVQFQLLLRQSYAYYLHKINIYVQSISAYKAEPTSTDQQSGVLTITPKRPLRVGDTEKHSVAFSHA